MSRKGIRPRAQRRQREWELRDLVKDREKLAGLEPGGRPDRAITVTSAAVVEGAAGSTPCHQCGGDLSIEAHTVERVEDDLLRAVRCRCRRCHAFRTLWFRLG